MSNFDPAQAPQGGQPQQPAWQQPTQQQQPGQPQQPTWQQPTQQPTQQQQPGQWQQPGQPQQPTWQQPTQQPQPGQPQQWQQPGQAPQQGWQPQQFGQPQPFGSQAYQSTAKKSPIGRIALALALVAVVGIGGFFVYRALGDTTGGAASPDEAVDNVVEAVDNEDFLTIGESLAPSEREAVFQPTLNLVTELERLNVVEDGTMDGGNFDGIEITVSDVNPRVEPVTDKISWVTIDSGTITTVTTPSELPVGDLVRDDVVNEPQETEVTNLAADPINFAVVEEDGDWFVSIYYSIAEQARRDAGKPIPNPATAPAPVGSASPEAVVEDLTRQISDLNGQGVLTLMDPEEFKAAYEYSSLYLPEIQADLDEVKREASEQNFTWNVGQVTSRTEERNGETVVIITGITVSGTADGETVTGTWDGQCVTIAADGDSESFCRQDLIDEMDPNDPARGLIEADYGFRVVERDGRWYLAGYPTLVGGYADGLNQLTPEQLRQLFDSDSDSAGGVGGLLEQVEGITI